MRLTINIRGNRNIYCDKLVEVDRPKLRDSVGKDELCLGVITDNTRIVSTRYEVLIGPKGAFDMASFTDAHLVSLKTIPSVWKRDLDRYYSFRRDSYRALSKLGYVVYTFGSSEPDCNKAFVNRYYPKGNLGENRRAINLPYFLEAITTHHMKMEGFEYISTGPHPSYDRIKQLRRIELPLKKYVEIDIWLKNIGRGIRGYIKKPKGNRNTKRRSLQNSCT